MPKKLIAMVATAVMVAGQRTVIQPGEPLPDDMSEHDQAALLGTGAAMDPAIKAGEEAAAKAASLKAAAEFQQSRQAVVAEQESLAPAAAEAPKPTPEPTRPPKAK